MLRFRLRFALAAAPAFFAALLAAPALPAVGPEAATAAWVWPVSGEVITPYRNGSDPYATGQHRGIDIAAAVGTPVRAAAAGDVRFAGTAGSSGLTISIRTGDGYDTSYLHLSALDVRAGARVSAGDRVGAVGTTGTRSAAMPHLHFGVRDAGTRHAYHDPLAFLPPAPPASPTPEPPAPAPAPSPAPTRPSPAPAPVPRAAPGPRRAPIPRGAPVPRRAPMPRVGPAPVPRAAPPPADHRLPLPASSPRRIPIAERSPHLPPSALPRVNPSPMDGPGNRAGLMPSGAAGRSAEISSERAVQPLRLGPVPAEPQTGRARGRRDAGRGGIDIGLLLACAGLLLAAGVLGLTEDGRRTTTRTRSKLIAALPVLGRR